MDKLELDKLDLEKIGIMDKKIISDPIHNQIELSDTAIKIIDTPIFQRLRNIKQLGTSEMVFPSASHSRFEHSIGVAHLGKQFMITLKNNDPSLDISEEDILLTEIAGLCHDLGHGPFSHAFDDYLERKCKKEDDSDTESISSTDFSQFIHHEERSCFLLKHIVKKYKIKLSKIQVEKICEMIHPTIKDKNFKQNIICNTYSSLDVDKLDYITRDMHYLGFFGGFNHERLFKMCRIFDGELCFPKKEAFNIYELFRLRYRLHRQVCQHPVVRSYEYMIFDIIELLDPIYNISTSINDPEKFYKFTDSILDMAEFLPDKEEYKQVKHILHRMKTRDIYKFITEIFIQDVDKDLYNDRKEAFLDKMKELSLENMVIIQEMSIGLSGSKSHPIKQIRFFDHTKDNIRIHPREISAFVSETVNEYAVRFFTREKEYFDIILEQVRNLFNFKQWT